MFDGVAPEKIVAMFGFLTLIAIGILCYVWSWWVGDYRPICTMPIVARVFKPHSVQLNYKDKCWLVSAQEMLILAHPKSVQVRFTNAMLWLYNPETPNPTITIDTVIYADTLVHAVSDSLVPPVNPFDWEMCQCDFTVSLSMDISKATALYVVKQSHRQERTCEPTLPVPGTT